jgi:hypothetical protein
VDPRRNFLLYRFNNGPSVTAWTRKALISFVTMWSKSRQTAIDRRRICQVGYVLTNCCICIALTRYFVNLGSNKLVGGTNHYMHRTDLLPASQLSGPSHFLPDQIEHLVKSLSKKIKNCAFGTVEIANFPTAG